MGLTNGMRDGVRAALLAASLLGHSELANAQLPAADPPLPPAPTPIDNGAGTTPPVAEYAPEQISETIGGIKYAINLIDQHFRTHPQKQDEASLWREQRTSYMNDLAVIEKVMDANPSLDVRNAYGKGLDLTSRTLALYLNALASGQREPSVDSVTVTPDPSLSRPERRAANAPLSSNVESRPYQLMGTFNAGEFEGAKISAAVLKELIGGDIQQRGGPRTPMDQLLLDNLDKIQNAQDPVQLSQEMRPTIVNLFKSFGNMMKSPEHGSSYSEKTKGSLTDFFGRFGLSNNLPGRAGPDSDPVTNQVDSDPANAWFNLWDSRVEQAVRYVPPSNVGGREGKRVNIFGDMVRSDDTLKIVQAGASSYRTVISAMPDAADHQGLLNTLDDIILAKSVDHFNSASFGRLKNYLDAMNQARGLYLGANR